MTIESRADRSGWRRAYLTVGACAVLLLTGLLLQRLGTPAGLVVAFVALVQATIALAAAWTGGTMSAERYAWRARRSTTGLGLWLGADATLTAALLAAATAPWGSAVLIPALAGLIGSMLAMLLFGVSLKSSDASTLPEFLERRYGSVAVGIVASLATTAFCLLLVLALLEVATQAISSAAGISRFGAAALLAGFTCLVGIVGGMRSVARVQPLGLIMLVCAGAAIAAWLVLAGDGGLPRLSDAIARLNTVGEGGGEPRSLAAFATVVIAVSAMPHLLARLSGPRDRAEIRGVVGSAAISIVLMAASFAVAAASFPYLFRAPDVGVQVAAADLPVAAAGLAAAACVVLIVGTTASLVLAATLTLSQDLYRGLVDRSMTAGKALFLNRAFFLLIAIGVVLLLSGRTLDVAMLTVPAATLASAALFPTLILAVWAPRSTGAGAAAAILVGCAFAAYDFAAGAGAGFRLPAGLPTPIFALPASLVVAMIASTVARSYRRRRVPAGSPGVDGTADA